MPLLPEASPPKARHSWLLALLGLPGVLVLLLAGLVAWSWNQPVELSFGQSYLRWGFRDSRRVQPGMSLGAGGYVAVAFPDFLGGGIYAVDYSAP